MKFYTLKDKETDLYYRGHMGWSKKPRLFVMGGLKNSLMHHHRQFKEYKSLAFRDWIEMYHGIARGEHPRFELKEIEV